MNKSPQVTAASVVTMAVVFAVAMALIIYAGTRGESGCHISTAHAQTNPCRMIYVKSSSGMFVNLYWDASKVQPITNPFITRSDSYEIHTAGVGDLKIEEKPCQ